MYIADGEETTNQPAEQLPLLIIPFNANVFPRKIIPPDSHTICLTVNLTKLTMQLWEMTVFKS